jgi:hypothetical protein
MIAISKIEMYQALTNLKERTGFFCSFLKRYRPTAHEYVINFDFWEIQYNCYEYYI